MRCDKTFILHRILTYSRAGSVKSVEFTHIIHENFRSCRYLTIVLVMLISAPHDEILASSGQWVLRHS